MDNGPTLQDVCEEIVDCVNRTAPEDLHGDFYVIGTPAMRGNTINVREARRVNKDIFDRWTRRLLPREGDMLLAREAPVGPIVRVPKGGNFAAGQRTTHLRADEQKVDPRFLYYLLASPLVQQRIQAGAMGSTVPHLRVADVKSLRLPPLPALSTQHAIAEVLGAIDDKIAANERTTTNVSGYTKSAFRALKTKSVLRAETFDAVADIGGGGTPKTSVDDYWGGDTAWATPTDVTGLTAPYLDATSRTLTTEGLRSCSSSLYPPGSILMTSRATIGAFAIAQIPAAVNQGFIVANAKNSAFQWWLFHEMQSRVDEFLSHANGATFLELPRGRFRSLTVGWPSLSAAQEFNRTVDPLHTLASNILRENKTLAQTRDQLLPLLMSGKVTIKEAENEIADLV